MTDTYVQESKPLVLAPAVPRSTHGPHPAQALLLQSPHPVAPRILKTTQLKPVLELEPRLRVPFPRLEVHDQTVLHRKHSIIVNVLVPPIEYLRDQRLVARRADDEVNVRRAHGVAVEQLEQLAGRAVIRDGVARRPQAVQRVFAVGAGVEAAAQVHVRLLRVLLLVQTVRGRVPDVEFGALDGLAADEVGDRAEHVRVIGVVEVVEDDRVAHVALGGVFAPEGAEDGGGGGEVVGRGRERVGDFVDEGLDADDIVHELGFIAAIVGHFTGSVNLVI